MYSYIKLISVCALALCACQTNAAVILTAVPATFQQGSGVQSMGVQINSTANESIVAIAADFRLQAGSFTFPAAGTFGQAGFVGAGNIQTAFSSFNRGSADPRLGLLSIEFTAPQLLPSTPSFLASMNIDTTGLAVGTYNVTISNFASDAAANTSVNGSFSIITAVPEPTSLLLAGLGGCCLVWIRRRSNNKRTSINRSDEDCAAT